MSNLLIDHHRSRTAERSAVDRLAVNVETETEEPRSTPWSELIAPLTSRQRLVATLYYADDLSVGEIADAVEVSAGTVKSTLAKARRRLQSHQTIIDQRGATT